MKKNQKIILSFILCLFGFTNMKVSALEVDNIIINNNNIVIANTEYQNLLNLGFTDNEIMNMTLKEYAENKNLQGKIVSQNTVYNQNNILTHKDTFSTFGLQTGYIETTAKKMTTTIIAINDQYRYKVSVEWKNIPSTRSYDIIGIGIDTNVKIDSPLTFQQNFCYSSSNCGNSNVYTAKSTSTGATATFQIPTQTIVSLSSYLYFNIAKNTNSTITRLNAYGDYSHATKTISKNNANNHSVNMGGISLNSSISSYYDTMDKAQAIWTGSW